VKLKTIELVVDTTPERLGEFVTAKAWVSATMDAVRFKEMGCLGWGIINQLPDIKDEWVMDAYLFFLSEENRERFEDYIG
jgi:hypothetical protein